MKIEIIPCDFSNELHQRKISELIANYMSDEMGGAQKMPEEVSKKLPEVLASHPNCMVLFAKVDNEFAGITTCFTNISTFKAKPYFNIHDVAVIASMRGKGVGRKLLERVIEIAEERGYCKVNLEVRHDNNSAMHLYSDLGFKDDEPPMYFWTKYL